MRGIVIRVVLNAVALFITSGLIEGMEINGVFSALVAAMVLGIVNAVIRPIALILTLPLNILTVGLFTLIVNGFMLKIVSDVVVGFSLKGFWSSIFGAIILSMVSGCLSLFIKDK